LQRFQTKGASVFRLPRQNLLVSYAKINMKSKAFEPCCFEMESGSLKTGYCQFFEDEFPAKPVF